MQTRTSRHAFIPDKHSKSTSSVLGLIDKELARAPLETSSSFCEPNPKTLYDVHRAILKRRKVSETCSSRSPRNLMLVPTSGTLRKNRRFLADPKPEMPEVSVDEQLPRAVGTVPFSTIEELGETNMPEGSHSSSNVDDPEEEAAILALSSTSNPGYILLSSLVKVCNPFLDRIEQLDIPEPLHRAILPIIAFLRLNHTFDIQGNKTLKNPSGAVVGSAETSLYHTQVTERFKVELLQELNSNLKHSQTDFNHDSVCKRTQNRVRDHFYLESCDPWIAIMTSAALKRVLWHQLINSKTSSTFPLLTARKKLSRLRNVKGFYLWVQNQRGESKPKSCEPRVRFRAKTSNCNFEESSNNEELCISICHFFVDDSTSCVQPCAANTGGSFKSSLKLLTTKRVSKHLPVKINKMQEQQQSVSFPESAIVLALDLSVNIATKHMIHRAEVSANAKITEVSQNLKQFLALIRSFWKARSRMTGLVNRGLAILTRFEQIKQKASYTDANENFVGSLESELEILLSQLRLMVGSLQKTINKVNFMNSDETIAKLTDGIWKVIGDANLSKELIKDTLSLIGISLTSLTDPSFQEYLTSFDANLNQIKDLANKDVGHELSRAYHDLGSTIGIVTSGFDELGYDISTYQEQVKLIKLIIQLPSTIEISN